MKPNVTTTSLRQRGSERAAPLGHWSKTCSISQNVAGVTTRIFGEILLVVVFRRVEFRGGRDLRCDRAAELAGLVPFCLHTFRSLLLRFAGAENRRAILRAHVVVLPVQRRGIVHPKEIIQQRLVTQPGGIEFHLNRLRMASSAGADIFVSRVRGNAARVTNRSFDDTGNLAEDFLHAPKATAGQDSR